MKVWFNGRVVDETRARLSIFDHAFLYGDGLYATVRLVQRHILFWKDHYARFKTAAAALDVPFPWSAHALEKAVTAVARANRRDDASVRLTLSRGTGPLGLDPALCPNPTLVMQLHSRRDIETLRRAGVSAAIVDIRRSAPQNRQSIHKSTSAQNLVLACREARKLGAFEGLMLNAKRQVTEGTTSNVFFVHRGALHTPAISCGLLAGVTRQHVLRLARADGIRVREGVYGAEDLLRADEVFLTNASLEIMPVARLQAGARKKNFKIGAQGTLTQRLLAQWIQATRMQA